MRIYREKVADADRIPEAPFWKRALDILCILAALPGLVLLMSAIALFIKLVSPGPVFFIQERAGLRGRRFRCFKFRSMKPNSDISAHQDLLKDLMENEIPMTKMDTQGDKRLIPFGAMLRSSGLDELPQLINVLIGDMSIVGPRPCTVYEYQQYKPAQKERFETLPGLTGLWQVSGKNKTTFSEMVQLDIKYVHEKSLWLDLKIMARTLGVLLEQILENKKKCVKLRRSQGPKVSPNADPEFYTGA